jgi:branched-chain amino acid aminotransferase
MINYLRNSKILAMYSSYINAIVKDEQYMTVPIDDHLIHRGHGVATSLIVYNGYIYNLSKNISFIYKAANKIFITPQQTEEQTCQIIHDLVSSTNHQNLIIQVFLTAGTGNMMIVPLPNHSSLYAAAWELDSSLLAQSISEHSIEFPLSNSFHSQVQHSHYLVNVLCRENSKSKGGVFGVLLNESGFCLEGGLVIPALVTEEKTLIISKSSTNPPVLFRVLEFASILQSSGQILNIETRSIHKSEFSQASEAFIICQDFIFPLKSFNDWTFEGKPEAISISLRNMLIADYTNSTLSTQVDYSQYST